MTAEIGPSGRSAGLVKRAAALAVAGALLTDDTVRLGIASANAVPQDADGSVHVYTSLATRTIAPARVTVRYSLKPVRKIVSLTVP
jgi:hypothetical protein